MILIITPNDIPPKQRHLPMEKIKWPQHIRHMMDGMNIIIYGQPLKCFDPENDLRPRRSNPKNP